MPNIEWLSPPVSFVISNDEIHIWRADLSDLSGSLPEFKSLLSPDELSRLDRYHFEKDRIRFIVGRGILRKLLAHYLSVSASEVSFTYNRYGKPHLKEEKTSLCFNTSFSKDLQLIAIAQNTHVGIDIEYIDSDFPALDVAEKYFSDEEVREMRELPTNLQTVAFFECWTKKEAYIKAIGEGLSHSIPKLIATSGNPTSFLMNTKSEGMKEWFIASFVPARLFAASLASEGGSKKICYFSWGTKDGRFRDRP